ncbi:MAG: ABC transporter substrate-binding protein [Theionarchaea archaeon]|nr:ABC transporter substrate-binding protein [Theionarchaea archaeon]
MMRKRKFADIKIFLIACMVMLSIFAGCIGQAEEAPEETSAPSVPNADTLHVLAYGEPDQLDPATCYDARGSLVIHNLYDRLIGYDSPETTEIHPRLAERWEVSEDGMEYTFYLRKDATFHDGSPVTADAVKYSFDRVLKMNQPPAWMMAQCMDLNSTQVIDDYTVKITLTKPYAAFMPILCYTVASIVNPAVIEANGGIEADNENEWLNQNEGKAGCGPYELVEWIPNERIVLKRYDDYWRGPAKLENVKLSFIPEIGTRVMYLKKGDADIATGFPETNIPDVLGAEGLIVSAADSYDITFIVLGCRGALANEDVRQAVCMAMDYDTILQFVYHGYSERLNGVIPKGMFGWHDIPPYEYDIEGANALLDNAGYQWDASNEYRIDSSTGDPLGAEIAVPQGDEVRSQISLLWQSSLKKIGFKLDIREITWAMMYRLIRDAETDMIISGWLPDYADPDNYVDSMCGSANAKAIWGSDYKNEELDALIDQAKWEPDAAKRNELYKRISEIIKEDAPFVWLAQTAHVEVLRTWIKGYYYNPCQSIEFWAISKE